MGYGTALFYLLDSVFGFQAQNKPILAQLDILIDLIILNWIESSFDCMISISWSSIATHEADATGPHNEDDWLTLQTNWNYFEDIPVNRNK